MIRLLVISSIRSAELGEFLEKRGTFSVNGCYSSLSSNAVEIQNNIVKVDKTLYLYQLDENGNSNVNIRADMQMLQELLKDGSFFNPGEIIFMTQSGTSKLCQQAERYFISVMESCKYQNYSIKKIEGTISFSAIYDSLMGITLNSNFSNTYTTLWRTERNSNSSTAYEPQNDKDLILEPFVFQGLQRYEEQKKLLQKTSSLVELKDAGQEEVRYENPNLGQFHVDSYLDGPIVGVLSGKSKSGLSTWTAALAISSKAAGNKVLVIDYTSNSDLAKTIGKGSDLVVYSMKEMLIPNTVAEDGISLCYPRNDNEQKVILNFMRHYFSDLKGKGYDVILVAVDTTNFENVYALLHDQLQHVFLTVTPRHSDVVELQKYINTIDKGMLTVLMNESISLNDETYLGQEQIKELLIFLEPRVVKSIEFKSLAVGKMLYKKLLKQEE